MTTAQVKKELDELRLCNKIILMHKGNPDFVLINNLEERSKTLTDKYNPILDRIGVNNAFALRCHFFYDQKYAYIAQLSKVGVRTVMKWCSDGIKEMSTMI